MILPVLGNALTLGNISVRSALGEPFDAEILLSSVRSGELDSTEIRLGSSDDFRRAGIERTNTLLNLTFRVLRRRDGTPIVQISSRSPVQDPFLDFLVESRTPQGRTVRQYTILLDPPAVPAAMRAAPPVSAPKVAPTRTGTIRRAPAPQPKKVAPAPRQSSAAGAAGAGAYGPTRRNDTAWNIANDVRPDSSISTYQMMMALLAANPGAFSNYNVNNLKSGELLQVPTEAEIRRLSKRDAHRQFQQQYTDWKAGVPSAPPATTAPQVVSQATRADAQKPPPAAPSGDGKLVLVAPPEDDGKPQGGSASGVPGGDATATGGQQNVDDLRRQRDLAQEAAHTAAQETLELRQRTDELESRIADLERLLTLRDADLSSLQNRVAMGSASDPDGLPGADPGGANDSSPGGEAEPAPPVTGETMADSLPGDDAGGESSGEPAVPDVAAIQAVADGLMPQPSAVDLAMENWPLLAAGAGGLVVLGGGLIWMRRRGGDSMDEASGLEQEGELGAEADAGADVIREVNQFLAYGRPQQAEERLKQEIAADPDRLELSVKLLEVYSRVGNKEAFDALAAETYARMGRNPEHPDWRRVAGMGRRLSPNNPLYTPVAGAVTPPAPAVPSPPRPAPAVPAAAAVAGTGAAVAAAMSSPAAPAPAATPAAGVGEAPAFDELEEELRRLEAEIGAAVAEDGDTSGGAVTPHQPATDAVDEMDFDLSFGADAEVDVSTDTDAGTDSEVEQALQIPGTGSGIGSDTGSDADDGLEFDWNAGGDSDDEGSATTADVAMDFGDDGGLSFDSDNSELGDAAVVHGGAPSTSVATGKTSTPSVDEFDFSSLGDESVGEEGGADLEELTTKLDLARAYVDMDDEASAKDILEEVLKEATGSLRDEAETLSRQLG